jgi:integrase
MARIFKRRKSWYVDYSYKGKRIRKRVGKDKKTAELVLKDIEVKMAKGKFLGVKEDTNITFSEFNEKYLEFCKANNTETTYGRKLSVAEILKKEFGDRPLRDINPEMVERVKSDAREGLEASTINRRLSYLKHMFNLAVEWEYIGENPASNVKKLREPPGRVRCLSEEEEKRLLRECVYDIYDIVLLDLNTGLRRGELFALKWSDVDLENRKLTVRNGKNGEQRIIPLNEVAVSALRDAKNKSNGKYIFPGIDGGKRKDLKTGFNNACRRAGIEDFTFHDLRHTFASRLVRKGVDLLTVKELLGHKSIVMTQRYAHLAEDSLAKAVSKLAQN